MKTIDATLTTAQKTGAGRAIARASVADNGKLHLFLWTDDTSDAETEAVLTPTAIVRARFEGATLSVQRVTDPLTAAQWSSWTALAVSDDSVDFALFYDGTYIVLAWSAPSGASTNEIRYTRSADDGLTWSADASAYAPEGGSADHLYQLGGISGADGTSGLVSIKKANLKFRRYVGSTNTWIAAVDSGLTFTARVACAGIRDATNSRYTFYYIGTRGRGDPLPGGIRCITYNGAAWAEQPMIADGRQWTYDRVSIHAKIGSYWWLAYRANRSTTDAAKRQHFVAASTDGLYFQDGVHAPDKSTATKLNVIGTMSGYTWAATEQKIHRSVAKTFWSNREVIHYRLDLSSSIEALVSPVFTPLRLGRVLSVQVLASGLAAPDLFSVLTLERGYNVAGTDYYQSIGTFYVTAYHWLLQDNILEVEATDALGLLFLWTANQDSIWENLTLTQLLTLTAARAGVHTVTFDANAAWADLINSHSIDTGDTALNSLEVLLRSRAFFEAVVTEAGALSFYVPTAAPASTYTYGYAAGQHVYWKAEVGRDLSPNWSQVILPKYANTAIYSDVEDQADLSRRLVEAELLSAASATSEAENRGIVHDERKHSGEILAPPAFQLELGDVIAFGAGQGASLGPWRVIGLTESFNPPTQAQKYTQRIILRGTTT